MDEIVGQLARQRSALEHATSPARTSEAGRALAESLAELRRRDPARAVAEAEAALAQVTALARADGPRLLPSLTAITEQFARCCQRVRAFERGAAAFAQAVEGAKLLAVSGAISTLELAALYSAQALCQAQAGALEPAHASATRCVELARAQLWEGLPLAVGALSLLADLDDDLGRPAQARAQLERGLGLLADAASAGQPGVAEAAAKLRAQLDARA